MATHANSTPAPAVQPRGLLRPRPELPPEPSTPAADLTIVDRMALATLSLAVGTETHRVAGIAVAGEPERYRASRRAMFRAPTSDTAAGSRGSIVCCGVEHGLGITVGCLANTTSAAFVASLRASSFDVDSLAMLPP